MLLLHFNSMETDRKCKVKLFHFLGVIFRHLSERRSYYGIIWDVRLWTCTYCTEFVLSRIRTVFSGLLWRFAHLFQTYWRYAPPIVEKFYEF